MYVIYISNDTSYLYPNLYEQGESLTGSQSYDLTFTGIETTQTITDSQQPNIKSERFFQFDLPDLSTTKDGYYTFTIKKGETTIFEELCYIDIKTAITYNENTISTTYAANGTL